MKAKSSQEATVEIDKNYDEAIPLIRTVCKWFWSGQLSTNGAECLGLHVEAITSRIVELIRRAWVAKSVPKMSVVIALD